MASLIFLFSLFWTIVNASKHLEPTSQPTGIPTISPVSPPTSVPTVEQTISVTPATNQTTPSASTTPAPTTTNNGAVSPAPTIAPTIAPTVAPTAGSKEEKRDIVLQISTTLTGWPSKEIWVSEPKYELAFRNSIAKLFNILVESVTDVTVEETSARRLSEVASQLPSRKLQVTGLIVSYKITLKDVPASETTDELQNSAVSIVTSPSFLTTFKSEAASAGVSGNALVLLDQVTGTSATVIVTEVEEKEEEDMTLVIVLATVIPVVVLMMAGGGYYYYTVVLGKHFDWNQMDPRNWRKLMPSDMPFGRRLESVMPSPEKAPVEKVVVPDGEGELVNTEEDGGDA